MAAAKPKAKASTESKGPAKKEVAVKGPQELMIGDFDLAGDAGVGMEGATRESFAIPFLGVLQKISPQCEESDAKYIEGSKGGMLFNSITSQLFDGKEGAQFLPATYQRRFLRWGPRGTDKGGFKGEYMPEAAAELRDAGEVVELDGRLYFPLEDGTIDDKQCDRLVDTRNHFGILVNEDGTYSGVVISLASTQIKKSKQLMTMLQEVRVATEKGKVNPPTWFNVVRCTSVPESNEKGNWYGIKFAIEGNLSERDDGGELYGAAKALNKALSDGTAGTVQYAEPEEAGTEEGGKF